MDFVLHAAVLFRLETQYLELVLKTILGRGHLCGVYELLFSDYSMGFY